MCPKVCHPFPRRFQDRVNALDAYMLVANFWHKLEEKNTEWKVCQLIILEFNIIAHCYVMCLLQGSIISHFTLCNYGNHGQILTFDVWTTHSASTAKLTVDTHTWRKEGFSNVYLFLNCISSLILNGYFKSLKICLFRNPWKENTNLKSYINSTSSTRYPVYVSCAFFV